MQPANPQHPRPVQIIRYSPLSQFNITRYAKVHIHSHAFHASLAGGVFSLIHTISTTFQIWAIKRHIPQVVNEEETETTVQKRR